METRGRLLVTVVSCAWREASAQAVGTLKLKIVRNQFDQNSLTTKDVCYTIDTYLILLNILHAPFERCKWVDMVVLLAIQQYNAVVACSTI